ncbi:MAG TPA: response regulator [Xanthobacteraceae bacterium]|jgi:DNA-binding response OmpR family regulator|nr:response regulator [Xanthobacteraceae bacterium]
MAHMLGQALAADDGKSEGVKDTARAPRLLVIDDDTLHRMIICRAAAKSGYVPVGAASHHEAAKLSQEGVFDCITLDIALGDRGGAVTLLRHFAAVASKAPIIVVSACDDETLREILRLARSLKLNVAEPVPKPVDLTILRYMLDGFRTQPAGAENLA